MAIVTLELPRGTSRDFTFQVPDPADPSLPSSAFLASDTLAASLWSGRDALPALTPPATWIDAATATFQVSFIDSATASLPTGTYRLLVTAARSGRTAAILDARLRLTDAPGGAQSTAPCYVSEDDLRDCASWIDDLDPDDGGQAGFINQRTKASAWLNELIVGRFKYSDMSPLIGQLGYGPYRLSGGNDPFPSIYIRQLLGMEGNPPAARPGPSLLMVRPQTVEIVANRAIYLICRDDLVRNADSPYAKLARRFAAEANSQVKTYRAELDINGDGYADIVVNLGATNLR